MFCLEKEFKSLGRIDYFTYICNLNISLSRNDERKISSTKYSNGYGREIPTMPCHAFLYILPLLQSTEHVDCFIQNG